MAPSFRSSAALRFAVSFLLIQMGPSPRMLT